MEKFKREIKENLLWMHNYHIVHRDVKPSNCMYNPALGRYVLIDFGISQIVEEGFQQLTTTMSCGTLEYMTNELKALHKSKTSVGTVNVYEADMYAYDKTVEIIKQVKRRLKGQTQ